VPYVGRVLAGRRLCGSMRLNGPDPNCTSVSTRSAPMLHLSAIDVRIGARRGKARALMQGEMQSMERPGGIAEAELALERLRQLLGRQESRTSGAPRACWRRTWPAPCGHRRARSRSRARAGPRRSRPRRRPGSGGSTFMDDAGAGSRTCATASSVSHYRNGQAKLSS
jgi:hypothetical protein